MAHENDYHTLMSGLQELDFQGKAVPSDLVLIGDHAFPLAINRRGQVLMAASRYGQGRIVVLGHEEYLTSFPDLVENALMWLMPRTGDASIVGVQGSLCSVADNLCYSPVKTEIGDFRNGLAIYVSDAYSVDACAKDLIAFLKAGGGLLIAGQAWSWAAAHPKENTLRNFPGNKVCSVSGIYFSEHQGELGNFPVPTNIPSTWLVVSISKELKKDLEFLLEGVPEFDIQGKAVPSEVMVHGPLAFPIGVTQAGNAFIAGAYYGQGRVIVATHEDFLRHEPLSTFLINAIQWLDEGRKGVIGVLPKLKPAYNILSKSGLECQLTNFRKDLSVYVCTSYSDAQCEEIQDFVAEGGGLLIGGQARHWTYSHRSSNVMTEYPGNHILNKMGLCIFGNTLRAGLYKVPEIDHSYVGGYHFRHMLQRFAEHVTQGQKLTKHEEGCLERLGNDCASYLHMQAHDCAAYTLMLSLLTDMVKEFGVPQVYSNSPVKSEKDRLMLHIGTELYKVSPDPDAIFPYIIKDRPNLPTVSNARVSIHADTAYHREWISTGLYLSPGMRTNIAIPPEIIGKHWKVQIGCQTDNIGRAKVLWRAPVVHKRFPLDKEMVQVWNLWGGLLYLIAPPNTKVDKVEIVVQTAVPAPYFKSGETTVADWVGGIRQAPAPWAELEFENIIISLASKVIRNLDHPDEVASLWDSIMRGVADLAAKPPKLPRKERFVADVQISAGFMHSGYPIMMHSSSAPALMNPERARQRGLWGQIHELGHNQQRSVWEFRPHTTECTCNLWTVYVQEEVLGLSRDKGNLILKNRQHRVQKYIKNGKNLKDWKVWTALETYLQLQEKFGWDAFKKVFSLYHDMNGVPNDNSGKMNLYAETFSKVVNMNLSSFFKAWGWPIQPNTEEKLSQLPEWDDHPMAQYKNLTEDSLTLNELIKTPPF